MYFTMGYHKGHDVYNANLRSANNFAQALLKTLSCTSDVTSNKKNGVTNTKSSQGDIKWKVIVTGTDATRPSTQEDITVEWVRTSTAPPSGYADGIVWPKEDQVEKDMTERIELIVPSYKIGKWNYVYAMSKLGQFYIIADAIATLTTRKDIYEKKQKDRKVNLSEIVKNISRHIEGAGENFMYDETIENIVSMDELDKISSDWTDFVKPLIEIHLAEATCLSVMYTPLHCRSWVTQAVKSCNEDKIKYGGSSRAHIVFQIVKRLSNAISVEMGTRFHTRHGYVEQVSDFVTEPTDTIIDELLREDIVLPEGNS